MSFASLLSLPRSIGIEGAVAHDTKKPGARIGGFDYLFCQLDKCLLNAIFWRERPSFCIQFEYRRIFVKQFSNLVDIDRRGQSQTPVFRIVVLIDKTPGQAVLPSQSLKFLNFPEWRLQKQVFYGGPLTGLLGQGSGKPWSPGDDAVPTG